jgi:hypothetical protein
MQETWGERVTRIIIDEEMKRADVIYIDGLADRLTAYLDAPERERYLADAAQLAGEPVTDLLDAFIEFIPASLDVRPLNEGLEIRPFVRLPWQPGMARH